MPLSNPPSVDVIYGELNTPPANTAVHDFDTWYDINLDDITASKTAVLARMGLSYAAGTFTALRRGVWEVLLDWDVNAAPGGACNLQLTGSDYTSSEFLSVANPNTLGNVRNRRKMFALPIGGTFKSQQGVTNGTDVPLDYMDMTIIRVV